MSSAKNGHMRPVIPPLPIETSPLLHTDRLLDKAPPRSRVPTQLQAERERLWYMQRLRKDEDEIAELGKTVLQAPCYMANGAELETAAVLPKGVAVENFPLKQDVRKQLFHNSPYVQKITREALLKGHTDQTQDGDTAIQLEFTTGHRTRVRCSPDAQGESKTNGGRLIAPSELARVLEILPKILQSEAKAYKLDHMDFSAVPFRGEWDQASSLHLNFSLENDRGQNLFEGKGGKATPLMLCFIQEMIDSDRDATALYAPTPDAYKRLKTFSAPQYVGLGVKRGVGKIGSMLIRGAAYPSLRTGADVIDVADADIEVKTDGGGARLEHRMPCPEVLTLAPEKLPYILMHYYLTNLKRALVRYDKMRKEGTLGTLSEKALQSETMRTPFPATWDDAVKQFKGSERMKEVLGEDFHAVTQILDGQSKDQSAAGAREVAAVTR